MPTALLPGIGASIRMLRAARAMDRSSDSASIRLTLMCGAGWTSYCVTTGPALRPTMRASMSKLLSFSMIRASFHTCTASAVAPAAAVGSSLRSSSSIGGRTHAIASRRAGESAASVTSAGSRSAVAATAIAGAAATTGHAERRDRRGRGRRVLDAVGNAVAAVVGAPDARLARGVDRRDLRGAALAAGVGHHAHAHGGRGGLCGLRVGALRGDHGVGRAGGAVLERRARGLRRARRGRHERAQRHVEGDEQPRDREPDEDDERAGRREQRLEQAAQEPADPAARELARELDQLDQAEDRRRRPSRCPAACAPTAHPAPCPGPTRGTSPTAAARTAAASARRRSTAPRGCATSRSGPPGPAASGRSA